MAESDMERAAFAKVFRNILDSDRQLNNFWPPEPEPEPEFVWSAGQWCEVVFPFSIKKGKPGTIANDKLLFDLVIDLDVYREDKKFDGQNVLIYVNGYRVASRYITDRTTVLVDIPAAWLREIGNVITFDTPNSRSPSEFGDLDGRVLGIKLYSLQLSGG